MPNPIKPPRVSLLSNNLAGGGSLACLTLARALQYGFEIQLIGSTFGDKAWAGVRDCELPVQQYAGGSLPGYLRTMHEISAAISGDIVIAHQFRLSSYGIALMHRFRTRTPVAVYIDDDDIALTLPGRNRPLRNRLRAVTGDIPTGLMYRLRNRADATFCGSPHFAKKFSGLSVPLGRDPNIFDPALYDREAIRHRQGLRPSDTVIGFLGNPRPHVGIEDLVNALAIANDDNLVLLVAPPGSVSDFARDLFASSPARIQVLENQSSHDVPGLLAATDLVVVPQRTESHSVGQLPARLVDAMAMGRPVITSQVGDIPEILGEAAVFVEERDPQDLARAMLRLRNDDSQARSLGNAARAIFLREFSLEAMAERMVPRLHDLIAITRG